ncbi:MAG TPA: NAD-dependent epimerase/dehydratase family protein [Thermoanaerobaculia bacterium]|nr:NAD-dependent epimerase/dehydratase family protein [Thermoanaerobaculia bacterium]
MRIHLTGATGYIGGALARRLVGSGHEVRATVRPASDAGKLQAAGIATFPGDITDRPSMREAMSGADWVIHCAAELDFDAPLERMREVNVQGSDNVASLAFKLGVGRVLALSSMAAFGGSKEGALPATEDSPPLLPFPSRYSATKAGGEAAVREWEKRGLRLNVVYPSLVYGPPGKKSGSNALLRALLKGRIPALVAARRPTSWIYLEDLVEGMVRMMERAQPGRHYLMTGDVASVRQVAEKVCALGGVRPPGLTLPTGVARLAANLLGPVYSARGRRPPFSIEQINSLTRDWAFDDTRARTELDWRPRTLDEGLPPTVEHLLAG